MCVSASVCLSVLEVSLPPIGRLAPSERVGRGFKDFFGTRGGNGLCVGGGGGGGYNCPWSSIKSCIVTPHTRMSERNPDRK